ncbi:helix-turn-helix domain-containing protein [Streptomyces sp. JNUCC 64]
MDHEEPPTSEALLEQGLEALRALLGEDWRVALRQGPQDRSGSDLAPDALVSVEPPDGQPATRLLVEARPHLTPRDVELSLLPKADLLRRMGIELPLLAVAPWLSPRTRQVLREHGVGYLDFTGNAFLRMRRPLVVIDVQGSARAPKATRPQAAGPRLSGAKAGRLVRLLADVAPPYRATDLAAAANLSLPYVSRLLDTLEEQLLIRRDGKLVVDVDWRSMLRVRAEQLTLLRHNPYVGVIAQNGVKDLWGKLRGRSHVVGYDIAVTGSYAARSVRPLAVGGQLMLYVPSVPGAADDMGDALGLLPVEEGADVLLLRAHDDVVFERTAEADGVRRVALSQLAIDCLSGPGRMPAEGEAVLEYMAENERRWRADGL